MTPKVTVIIPIYKVEKYLERCVYSVFKQTLINIQIILVDDGSPDNCPNICDRLSKEDNRVEVIHKKNGGLASARNAGLKQAKGDYIFFLDSDDWIDENSLEELVLTADSNKVDFVRFRPMYAGWPNIEDGTLCDFGTEEGMEEGIYNREMIINEVFPRLFATPELTLGVIVAAWRSLYNREFLEKNHLLFDDNVKYSEDTIFSAKVVYAAQSFYYLDGARYYHYFYNAESITKSFRSDRWDSCKELMATFEKNFLEKDDYDFSEQLELQKLYCVASALGQRNYIADRTERKQYCKMICEDTITIGACRYIYLLHVPLKMRIMFYLIRAKAYGLISKI